MSYRNDTLPMDNLPMAPRAPGSKLFRSSKKSVRRRGVVYPPSVRYHCGTSRLSRSTISVALPVIGVALKNNARTESSPSRTSNLLSAYWMAIPYVFFSLMLYVLWISSTIISDPRMFSTSSSFIATSPPAIAASNRTLASSSDSDAV